MKRELRWPIAVALLVAAVAAGPTLVQGTIGWVQAKLGEGTTNADAASSASDEDGSQADQARSIEPGPARS